MSAKITYFINTAEYNKIAKENGGQLAPDDWEMVALYEDGSISEHRVED